MPTRMFCHIGPLLTDVETYPIPTIQIAQNAAPTEL